MESVVPKVPVTSIAVHLQKASDENAEKRKDDHRSSGEQSITAPKHELKRVERHHRKLQQHPLSAPGASHEKARLLSNKTRYNPHDPDARISVKPDKARKLNYHCSMAVDTAEGVISHMQADFADGRDSQWLPGITTELQTRLKENELLMANLLLMPVTLTVTTTAICSEKASWAGSRFLEDTKQKLPALLSVCKKTPLIQLAFKIF